MKKLSCLKFQIIPAFLFMTFLGFSVIVPVVNAEPVTINITAVVDQVADSNNILHNQIQPNEVLRGTYTYDTTTSDSIPTSDFGEYFYPDAQNHAFGFKLQSSVNMLTFETDLANATRNPYNLPFAWKYVVEFGKGDASGGQVYTVSSMQNNALFDGTLVDSINFELIDPSGTALSNDLLSTNPPDLGKWKENTLLIVGYPSGGGLGGPMYQIWAKVTSASIGSDQAPVANAGPDTLAGSSLQLNGGGSYDPDDATSSLTYTWTQVSGPSIATLADPTSAYCTASSMIAGEYVFRLTVKDPKGATAFDDVSVAASPGPVNQPPNVNAGQDISCFWQFCFLHGSATDDGLPSLPGVMTYEWSKVNGPGDVRFGNPNSLSTVAVFSAPGTYTLQLTASDGALTSSDTVIVYYRSWNQAPLVNITSPRAGLMYFKNPFSWPRVHLTASAFDLDGSVTKVDYYDSSTWIGSSTTAPYAVDLPVSIGTHDYIAKATDNQGAVGTSGVVTVRVIVGSFF